MSYYWAIFKEAGGHQFRFDTRIYLEECQTPTDDDFCIGAVVGKNPGSAKSMKENEFSEIILDGDKLLPTVRNIILKAYDYASSQLPKNGYVQILNLFYLCDENLSRALNKIQEHKGAEYCNTENQSFKWIFYVWGGDNTCLDKYKDRFKNIKADVHFFYDKENNIIMQHMPSSTEFAKHTQGMKQDKIISFIARDIILSSSAKKITASAKKEHKGLEGAVDDGI